MATTKKTINTTAKLRAEMKKNGVRLAHGYEVVKRSPAKKKSSSTAKKATTAGKSAKLTVAQRKFAANAKRAGEMVRTGKAKDMAAAWKIIKKQSL